MRDIVKHEYAIGLGDESSFEVERYNKESSNRCTARLCAGSVSWC